ncbi:MAG: ABC transporter ATP-binding protein [Candidatus Thermoplasmatota archaeon]|nr:ABC transporter ATP-binding protein [Candidatus Thermoplasmatota archaeon]
MTASLEARGLTVRFGGLVAVDSVDLTVPAGELTALVGPNGAGKSTLFNAFTGHVTPTAGQVLYAGREITAIPTHERAHRGLVRTWQIARPFHRLTCLENVLAAAPGNPGNKLGLAALGLGDSDEVVERAHGILDYVGLDHMTEERAGKLSGGQRKLLEIARGLMLEPKVLLLDEPFAGVNPTLANEILVTLHELHDDGLTIFLVEHNMDIVMEHCPRVVVMAQGRVLTDGTPDEVRSDQRVIDAYLGGTM